MRKAPSPEGGGAFFVAADLHVRVELGHLGVARLVDQPRLGRDTGQLQALGLQRCRDERAVGDQLGQGFGFGEGVHDS